LKDAQQQQADPINQLMSSPPRLQRTEAMIRKMMARRRCGIGFLFISLSFRWNLFAFEHCARLKKDSSRMTFEVFY